MEIGTIVTRNPNQYHVPDTELGIIVEVEDEDEIIVIWSCGRGGSYSVYDLEVIEENEVSS